MTQAQRVPIPTRKKDAAVGDVIQLDPTLTVGADWGPLLCIVDKVKAWGVRCYHMQPTGRNEPLLRMYIRVNHLDYVVIGPAEWTIDDSDDDD